MTIFKLLAVFLMTTVLIPAVRADQIAIDGEWEVVFDWTNDRCNDQNIPDLPTRAFRDANGDINLLISHTKMTRMMGADFENLAMDCTVINTSAHNPDPSLYTEAEWISSVYTDDGINIFALIHNEFQGNAQLEDGVCPSFEYFKCWYNTITAAMSADGGTSFEHLRNPPEHLVANFPKRYIPDGGVFGAFSPSNIIEKDGYYYAYFKLQTYFLEAQHTCLMRTDDLSDPASWRYWNGVDFIGEFADPYREEIRSEAQHTCAPIALNEIAQMYEGIVWNTYLEKYVLVGTTSDPTQTPNRFGFYYALSDDLIHWEHRVNLLELPLPWTVADHRETNYLYPTLIDHDSPSMSFETSGEVAYLYFTRNNFGQGSLDRDLLRVKVRFEHGE